MQTKIAHFVMACCYATKSKVSINFLHNKIFKKTLQSLLNLVNYLLKGEIILLMQKLEDEGNYGVRSYWHRPPSTGMHVNGFCDQRTYQTAVVDRSKLEPLKPIEKLYPLKMVEVLRENNHSIDNLTVFDIKGKADRRIELDKPNDIIVRFTDDFGRMGIAFCIETIPGFWGNSKQGVLTIFQRFANTPDKWAYTISSLTGYMVHSQEQRLSLNSLSRGSHSFGSEQDYIILSNLLANKDPLCQMVKIMAVD